MHRRPCPFFRSVEFWAIAVKTLAIAPLMLPAILKAGFSLESLLLIAGLISQGVLAALKELESTPNLYTPRGIIGNDLKDAVGNIINERVAAIACDSPLTRAQVADSFDPSELVEAAVKPSLRKAITTAIVQTIIPKQLRGLF